MTEHLKLTLLLAGLILAGWLDGQDAKMAEQYSVSIAGQQLACLSCAGGVR
ncbi:MAG: hypothetical protein RL661_877 [Pseudomonadota bacterium]|jgi:hypothetical protein